MKIFMWKPAHLSFIFLILSMISSCSMDTNVKTFDGSSGPIEAGVCEHIDAIKDHPICEQFKSACVFYACKNTTDPNYGKYLEYKDYIEALTGVAKAHSTIIHDSSLCANKGSKIDSVVFSVEPSNTAFMGEYLSTQPEVSILRENGVVATVTMPVTLSVHQDATCSDAAIDPSNWSMASANPVNTINGKHLYQNLKFLDVGTYYLKAESGSLKPACSIAIAITENQGIGTKVVFLDPKPSSEALHSRDLDIQPKVGIVNNVGDVVDVDNVNITLTLHTDDKCLSANVTTWEANANPVASQNGISQFGGVAIKAGGDFYFRATADSLLQSCYGPVKVADRLKFSQNPSGVVVKNIVLPQQPIVAVSHQDNIVAPFDQVPVALKVYTDTQCSVAANPADYVISANPVNSNASGLSVFNGLKFLKEAKFYLRGESLPLLPTECVPVDVGSSITKVIFVEPFPSNKNIKDTLFPTQPKVALVDGNGAIIPEDGKSVLISLHTDNACNIASGNLVVTTNPGQTTAGFFQFAGVQITQGGLYYLKASSPTLEPTCYGPIEVAEKLKLEQSNTSQAGIPLSQQPMVKVTLPNNSVVAISGVPVSYNIYNDAQCTQATASDKWSMSSSNPVNTNNSGIAQFNGVTINVVGTFYGKASTSANIDASECLIITSGSVAHSLVFAEPYFPSSWVKTKIYNPQPSVEARDASGNVSPVNIPVEISLHTNSDCSSAPLGKGANNFWDVDATPNHTTQGRITFVGFKVYKGGKYYLKAKTSSAGVIPACSFQFIVADTLHFNPHSKKDLVQNVASPLATIVQAVWQINPSNIHFTGVNDESVTISVFKNSKCAGDAVPGTDWFYTSSNPKNTVNGDAVFSGITFTKVGKYFLKATSPHLEPACSTEINVAPGSKRIIFLDPKPSVIGVKNKPLEIQPKVQIVDENNNPVTNDDKNIKITVTSDSSCSQEISNADYSINAPNPGMTSQGTHQFSGLAINKGGVFYIKASGDGLEDACHGPVEIADALSFVTQPATPHSNLSPILLNTEVGVVRPNNVIVTLSNIAVTLEMYSDSNCQGPKLNQNQQWNMEDTNPKNTVDGKVKFKKFALENPPGAGEYYLKALSPGLAPICSQKFVVGNGTGGNSKVGCMQPLASNFNPNAKEDDCSCVFKFCPIDKPEPGTAQAEYFSYLHQCPKAPEFINNCSGESCEDKKNPEQAEKNKNSGYKYQCDKLKEIYERDCNKISNLDCKVLKATYEACFRKKKCSEYGISTSDVDALQELNASNVSNGHKMHLYNIPDAMFNWFTNWLHDGLTSNFDSICLKLRYPGARQQAIEAGDGTSVALYDKYCDCTECEDPGFCNHSDADNYNPGGNPNPPPSSGDIAICSNVSQLILPCDQDEMSFACLWGKGIGHYCHARQVTCNAQNYSHVIAPACYVNADTMPCSSSCETVDAAFYFCAHPHNQASQYCQDFSQYYFSCINNQNPSPNPSGINWGCSAIHNYIQNCPKKCYKQIQIGSESCAEIKSYLDLNCASTTNPKCEEYKLKYKNKCSNSGNDDREEMCEFKACQDPEYEEYLKYLEYLEYCKKAGVVCDIESDPELCKTPIGKKTSLRPIEYIATTSGNGAVLAQIVSPNQVLNLFVNYSQNKIIGFKDFWVEAVNGANEVGPQLIPWLEQTHMYFYKDNNCGVAIQDPNCIIPNGVSSAAANLHRVHYTSTIGPWSCQLSIPNTTPYLIKSYKIKSVSGKKSLCRSVKVHNQ